MFSKLLSLFSLKRKFPSTEEANTSLDESSDRPTKRVRIEEPSSTNEDTTEPNPPVQAACTINEEETEENEVMDDILPRGTEDQAVERREETRAVDARLREIRNRVEPDAQVDRLPWQAAMDVGREQGRQQRMEEFWREQERVHEERRRHLFTRSHDEPMEDVERRLTAPLPLRRAGPPFSFSSSLATDSARPSPATPIVSASGQPNPRILNAWTVGSQVLPLRQSTPIFICPPPSQPSSSNSRRRPAISSPSSATLVDLASSETILAFLRQLRGQFSRAASPHPSQGDVDERFEDDYESGDEDLPLFSAMLQAGNPPQNSEHHREYPVYEEDLDLPEDEPQAGQDLHEELARLWELARRRRELVDKCEEDGETAEERLERLVREGEAEEGVDLE